MAEKKKSAIIMQLRPKIQQAQQSEFSEETLKQLLFTFAQSLVPKWPEASLREIINELFDETL